MFTHHKTYRPDGWAYLSLCSWPGVILTAIGWLALTAIGWLAMESPVMAQLDTRNVVGTSVPEKVISQLPNVDQAITRFKNHDLEGAEEFLQRARENRPALPPVQILLAKMYALQNRATLARNAIENAVKENPEDPEAFLIFAQQAYKAGRLTEAELLFERSYALSKAFEGNNKRKQLFIKNSLEHLANIAERRGDWTTSIDRLEELKKLDPDSGAVHQRLGNALFKSDLSNRKAAYQELTQAKKINSELPQQDVATARLLFGEKDYKRTKEFLNRAEKSDPDNPRTRLEIARLLMELGDYDAALPQLSAALDLEPSSVDGLILRGVVAYHKGNYELAVNYFEKAHLISPSNIAATNQMALSLAAQDDEEKRRLAREYAQIGLAQLPQSATALVTMAWTDFQLDNKQAAGQAVQEAQRLGNISPDAKYFVAVILADQKRDSEATRYLQSALETERFFLKREDAKKLLSQLQ